jgi:hypothetical protein
LNLPQIAMKFGKFKAILNLIPFFLSSSYSMSASFRLLHIISQNTTHGGD